MVQVGIVGFTITLLPPRMKLNTDEMSAADPRLRVDEQNQSPAELAFGTMAPWQVAKDPICSAGFACA
jgi:hypothetical protein